MFNKTRMILTGWYLLIIMLLSISFSVVIHKILTQEVVRYAHIQQIRMERRLHIVIADDDLVNEITGRITIALIAINGAIFFISGGLGFVLAGKTLEPIKEMMDEQNRFISDASHELRTPLTSLKTSMEVHLREKSATLESANSLIKESILEVNRLQTLSENLLQIAQYEMSKNVIKPVQVNIKVAIQDALKKTSSLMKSKQIDSINQLIDTPVLGNPYALVDLFVILIDNAVKYSQSGSRVYVKMKVSTKSVAIRVIDEGIGIEKEDLPHIFERFYRSDSARIKNNTGGYGLGLSIAKKIIDEHKGSITVKSNVGRGSEFIVTLPKG
ncbi:HAMP domain-containing histidine kinase [Candidatus Roizmanbacteria bacterium]|nr:HAMP domain-containing histidine kinase [Candidatus Roizmanbacteria bacterium]